MRRVGIALFALFSIPASHADLLDDFAARPGHQGVFEQRVVDNQDQVLAESAGDFALLKPGRFRWNITAPDSQLLVVDGESLWQYDRDLETVIRRQAADMQTSPLQLLTADRAVLEERYEIESREEGIRLTPRGDNDFFQSLTVSEPEADRLALSIIDTLGQRIELELRLQPETPPEASLFVFEPPEGVEWLEGGPSGMSGMP